MNKTQSDYAVLRQSAGYRIPNRAVISLHGAETLDFLHRLSTNDVLNLPVGQAATTILATEKGRIVDLVNVLNIGDTVYLIGSAGNSSKLLDWLTHFIIMEDIEVKDVTSLFQSINLIGPEALSIIQSLFPNEPPGIVQLRAGGTQEKALLSIFIDPVWNLPSYIVLEGRNSPAPIVERMKHLPRVSEEAFETVRIEEGVPEYGRELTEDINHLEAGLQKFVSLTKGCYIGQEVIARIDTYKKLQKRLTGIIIDTSMQDPIHPGRLSSPTGECGFTTSHAYSPKVNRHIALAYLKTGEKGPLEFVSESGGLRYPASISALPF